jgi:hypothetical protein
MVEAIGEDPSTPADDTGGCKHLRTTTTFTGELCRDCGEPVVTPGVPDSSEVAPISTLRTEEDSQR